MYQSVYEMFSPRTSKLAHCKNIMKSCSYFEQPFNNFSLILLVLRSGIFSIIWKGPVESWPQPYQCSLSPLKCEKKFFNLSDFLYTVSSAGVTTPDPFPPHTFSPSRPFASFGPDHFFKEDFADPFFLTHDPHLKSLIVHFNFLFRFITVHICSDYLSVSFST